MKEKILNLTVYTVAILFILVGIASHFFSTTIVYTISANLKILIGLVLLIFLKVVLCSK